ncbi:MAG: hypothetical protein IJO74_04905 [Clostridia bacterium]|nr:hypothetical protein [Clostridia bacterium]
MNNKTEKIKILILPKFEVGKMSGDAPGEAQHYYEEFLENSAKYEIRGAYENNPLYVKDGVALYVAGLGKVSSAVSLMAVLCDPRFDFSSAYVLSTGCCGGAYGNSVMGDVYLMSCCIDYDIGHKIDSTELDGSAFTTWIHDESYDGSAFKLLNLSLVDKLYNLVKDIPLKTTPKTKTCMASAFDNAPWAIRNPQVLKAAGVSGDNYWKGMRGHRNAELMAKTYNAPDPFRCSEMEDVALAVVMDRMGMLDRFIAIRGAVNMDVFMNGAKPEELWKIKTQDMLTAEDSQEASDIFNVEMENIFSVGRVIVRAVLDGII